jgi:hypothetical protein
MLDKYFKKNIHQTIQFIACIGIAIGLPWSKIPLSLATMLLGLNVILLNDWKKVFSVWFSNKILLFLIAFVAFEWLSLLWSSNLTYGLDDVRRKLPLLVLPLCISVIPLTKVQWKWVALFFLGSLFITTGINYAFYAKWIGNKTYLDYRNISLFISHIRLALLVVAGIVICIFWWIKKEQFRFLTFPLIAWFLFYTNISQVGFGYVGLGICVLFAFYLFIVTRKKAILKYGLLVFASISIGFAGFLLYSNLQPIPQKVKYVQEPKFTKSGNPYLFSKEPLWENGYPIMAFINEKELKTAWEKRSKLNYETGKGDEQLKFIIWHFMASKNLHKDKEGVAQLSDKEIKAIEERIPSVVMLKGGFNARFYEIRNQLADTEPNGKSLLMRLIYFKLGCQITKENFPFGVGSGDVQDAFNAKYEKNSFGLSKEYWNRAHNQYLTVLISSGIIGFILFLFIWFTIIRTSFKSKQYLFSLLTVLVLSSFLSEDTLESQTGVTIAAFMIGSFINFSKIQLNRDSIR